MTPYTLYKPRQDHHKHLTIINLLWACPKPHSMYHRPHNHQSTNILPSAVYHGCIPNHTPSSVYRPPEHHHQSTVDIFQTTCYSLYRSLKHHQNQLAIIKPLWLYSKLHPIHYIGYRSPIKNILPSPVSVGMIQTTPHTLYRPHQDHYKYFSIINSLSKTASYTPYRPYNHQSTNILPLLVYHWMYHGCVPNHKHFIIINALWVCPKPQPIYYTPAYYGRIPNHIPSSLHRPCGIFKLQNML